MSESGLFPGSSRLGDLPAPARPRAARRSFAEEIADGWEAGRRTVNLNKVELLREEATRDRMARIEKSTGVRLPDPRTDRFDDVDEDAIRRQWTLADPRAGSYAASLRVRDLKAQSFERRVAALKQKYPNADIPDKEETEAAIRARAGELEENLAQAGLGGFIGAAAAGLTDPVTAPTLLVGGAGGKTVLQAAVKAAGEQAAFEIAAAPLDQMQRAELGLDAGLGQAASNVALAATLGGALGGGAKALEGVIERITGASSRRAAIDETLMAPEALQTPEVKGAALDLERALAADAALGDGAPDADILDAHLETVDKADAAILAGAPAPEAPGVARPSPAGPDAAFDLFDPDALLVDARRFQFKSGGDAEGVTDALKGVVKWDPIKSGDILVWEDRQGRRFVADGHQRSGLARRLKAEGQAVSLRGVVLREADGVTDADARAIAAAKNIAQGTGSALDAAKILKARPDLLDGSLNLRAALARDAQGLARLGDDAFTMAINGLVEPNHAAIAGRLVDDPSEQVAVLSLLHRAAPANAVEAEALIREALAAGFVKAEQVDLFGASPVSDALMLSRAQILSKAVSQLRRDKKIFSTLADEADTIEAAGNVLSRETNEETARNAADIADIVLRTAHITGPVSDALKRASAHVAAGGQVAKAVRDFVGDLKALGPGALRGLDPSGRGPGGRGGVGESAAAGGRAAPPAEALDLFSDGAASRGAETQRDALTADMFGEDLKPRPEPKSPEAPRPEPEPAPDAPPGLDPDEMLLTGEEGAPLKSRKALEAEFRADEEMIERLKGCVRR